MHTRHLKELSLIPIVIGLMCIIATASAAAISACKSGCATPNKLTKFDYKSGKAYTYNLDSNVQIYIGGYTQGPAYEQNQTTLKVQGTVQIFYNNNCDYTLQIQKITIFGPDGKKSNFGNEITKPVQFQLSNDELNSEICADGDDTEFSLNIKRSIISLFQSADATKSHETDVFGVCPTSISISDPNSEGVRIVNKIRNLNLCGYREILQNGFVQATAINQANNDYIKTAPILKGDYNLEQRIKDAVIESAELIEEYSFVPFATGGIGPKSKITTKIQLQSDGAGTASKLGKSQKSTSVLFVNPKPQSMSTINTLKNAIKELLKQYSNNVGPKAATQFTELIRLMRYTKKDDLLSLYQQVKAGTVGDDRALTRKIYFDALFRVGNGEAVEVITNLLKNRELNESEKKLVFYSLNLVNRLSKEALTTVAKLLDGPQPKEAFLSIGTLVAKFCRTESCENADVKAIFDKFVNKLNNCRTQNRKEEDVVVAVLKGIRNTNNLINPAIDKVAQCTDAKFPLRIRVNALKTFSAAACNKKLQNAALQILKKTDEDSEVRIEAYLALMKCPTATLANEIKDLLDNEKIIQVGSFITSHLANIRSSTDPSRYNLRHYFENVGTSKAKQFPRDFRRYSFNHEYSYSVGALGFGASSDSNVIYSQKSFLPRSTSFNLTTELFGKAFNFLEVQGRQENLDKYIEHYFGPKGVFHTSNPSEIINLLVKSFHKVKEQAAEHIRSRRGTREEVNAFNKDNAANFISNTDVVFSDFTYDLSFKFFGSELYFLSLDGKDEGTANTPKAFIDKFFEAFNKGLDKLKDFNHVFENSVLFLDNEINYPTGIGFPLKIAAQGAAVVRIETKGQIDVLELLKNFRNSQFQLNIIPSANVEVTGTLSVDSFAVETGIQISGAGHTSTGTELKFALTENGKGLDVQFGLPLKKQELFSFENKIVYITRERGFETVDTPIKQNIKGRRNEFNECFDQIYPYVGVTFCAGFQLATSTPSLVTAPSFLINGPNKVSLWLEVDQNYHFQVLYDDKDPKGQSLLIAFDTPGSEKNRATSLKLEAHAENGLYVRATLLSPIRNANVEAGFRSDDTEVVVYANANSGRELEYMAKFGFKKNSQGSGPKQDYTPIAVIKTGANSKADKIAGYKVDGIITVDRSDPSSTKFTFNNVQLLSPTSVPVFVLTGQLLQAGATLNLDMTLTKDSNKGQLRGDVSFSPGDFKIDMSVLTNVNGKTDARLLMEFQKQPNLLNYHFLIGYGKDIKSLDTVYAFKGKASYDVSETEGKAGKQVSVLNSLKAETELTTPVLEITFSTDYGKNIFKYDFKGIVNKKSLTSSMDLKLNGRTQGDHDLQFFFAVNKYDVKLYSKHIIDNGKSRIQGKLLLGPNSFEVTGVVGHKFNAQEANVNLESTVILNNLPYKFNIIIEATPKNVVTSAKLLVEKKPYFTYDAKVVRAEPNANGNFEIMLIDLINGNGEFKSQNNRGDANFIIKFSKLGRTIKMDTKFNVVSPTFDITTDVYYDFENDKTKKVHVATKNKFGKNLVDSKNNLDISGEKYELNFNGERVGQYNDGVLKTRFNLGLANGRKISGDIVHEIHVNKDKTTYPNIQTTTGNLDIKLNDRLQNQQERTVHATAKVNNVNLKRGIFDAVYSVTYNNPEKKVIKASAEIKNVPKDENTKTAKIIINFNDDIVLKKNGEFNFNIDEYTNRMAIYNFNGKYDSDFDYDVKGKYNIGGRGVASTNELRAHANIQNPERKQYKLETNSKYLLSQDSSAVFDGVFNVVLGVNNRDISLSTKANGNLKHGNGGFKLALPDKEPISSEVSYTFDRANDNESTKATGSLKVQYDSDKIIEFNGNLATQGTTDISLNAALKSPLSNANNIDISLKHSSKPINNHHTTSLHINVDNKKFGVDSDIILLEKNPSFDINIIYPNPESKVVKLAGKLQQFGDRVFKSELIIQNLGDFNFNTDFEMNYQSAQNFFIKSNVDSANLKLNKIYWEIQSKAGSNGKGVEFKATSDNNNIVSGYADFTLKEEKGKTIVEGQGNVKVNDKSKAASFKFISYKYDQSKGDSETGVQYVLNGLVGPRKIVTEIKMTDKNFHIKHTMCEEKKQCINFEFLSVIKHMDVNKFNHELLISMDLRQLGYTHEFGLKALTSRENLQFDHTVDMHFHSQDKSKYQYSVYIHPKSAGITLTLPTRIVSLEGQFKYPDPRQSKLIGDYDASITLYLDKAKKPNHKGEVGLSASITRRDTGLIPSYIGQGEFKFQHPTIKPFIVNGEFDMNGPDQIVNGKLELDVFKSTDQKIIATAKYGNVVEPSTDGIFNGFNVTTEVNIKSKGLKFNMGFTGHTGLSLEKRQFSVSSNLELPIRDFRFGNFFFISTDQYEILINYFNENILHTIANYDLHKHTGNIKSTLKTFGGTTPPAIFNGKMNDITSFEFELSQDQLYKIKGELKLGKVASIVVSNSKVNKRILVGSISFDQTLGTEFNVDDQLLKEFVEQLRQTGENNKKAVIEAWKQKIELAKNKLNVNFRDVSPDFNSFYDDYKTELTALINELLSDTSIKEIFEYLNKIFAVVMANITEISSLLNQSINQAMGIILSFYNDTVNSITPIIAQFFETINVYISSIYNQAIGFLTTVFERIIKTVKLYEDDFNKISKSVYDISKKTFHDVNKYMESLIKELTDIYKLLLSYLEAIPGVGELRQKVDEMLATFMVPEYVLSVVQEFITYIKEIFPKGEVHEFADALIEYINNKAMKAEINDVEQLKELVVKFFKAVRSIFAPLVRKSPQDDEHVVTGILSVFPFNGLFKRMIPFSQQLFPNLKISTLNYLRNENLLSIRDILYLYRPYGFKISEILPPFTLHAYIADGIHIFTFDRRHLTFNGKCQYILAQDYVNNNFTIIGNFNGNGGFKSIILLDRDDQLELNDKGLVQLNGKNIELPTHNRDVHAWRDYNNYYLLSSYGAEVKCSLDLRVCQVTVSGYYLGQLRGLLGNGNSEPHDDFIQSNGKITDNYADFGNSYKTNGKTCAYQVPYENDHLHHHHGHENHEHGAETTGNVCNEFFSITSSLRYGYLFVDPTNYREACNHALHLAGDDETQKQQNACRIAEMYTAVCRGEGIPIRLPAKCRTCKDGAGKSIDIDTQYSVRSPQNQADIVIVVDTALSTSQFSELVQPLINDLRKELKARDITNVNIPVIGYNKDNVYPSLYTVQGKLDYTGKLASIAATTTNTKTEFTEPKYVRPTETGCTYIDGLLEKIYERSQTAREDYGLSSDATAFRFAMSYPFRSSASKTILAIRADSLHHSTNPSKSVLGSLANNEAKSRGIAVHVVTPVKDLTLIGAKDARVAKNIIGFNAKTVLQNSDAKKKSNLGSTEMRPNIKYDSGDMGVDMVQNVNGFVFALQNFNQLRQAREKKSYVTVMVNALADQISRTEIHSDCTCELDSGLYPVERCKAKETNLLPPVKKGGARG